MIQVGNDKIEKIYHGSDTIKEVYYGSELVWFRDVLKVNAFMTAAALPESYRKPLHKLVSSLISNNIWDKLIAIYPFCGDTYNSLKYNLKDPRDLNSAFRLAPGGAGTPSYLKNAIRGEGNLNTFISDKVVNLDSLSLSIFSITDNVNPGRDFSNNTDLADNRLLVSLAYAGNLFLADLYNATSERVSLPGVDSFGFFTISRTAADSLRAYKNGVQIAENDNIRTNKFLGDIFISGVNTRSLTYRTYEFICIGDGLDTNEASILYNIVTTFRNSINVSPVGDGYWIHKVTGVRTYFGADADFITGGIMHSPSWVSDCYKVKIPSGVTGLGQTCFSGSTSLTSIEIPESVTSLGEGCFYGCTYLTLVTVLPASPPYLGAGVFDNVHASLNIKVRSPYLNTYKTAAYWSFYASKISTI